MFPFALRATGGNTRTSVSTPRLRGPAVIMALHAAKGGAASGQLGLGLGKSLSSVRESSVSDLVPLPFTPLGEGLEAVGAVSGISPNHTTALLDMGNSLQMPLQHPGLIILDAEFFLVIYTATDGVVNDVVGFVTVAEQVSPQALANFR